MVGHAVRVRGIGKRFRLGQTRPTFPTLRDALAASVRRAGDVLRRRPGAPSSRDRPETFWALRDVTFDVAQGEVVGIIGGNGAGKSTLLKVLSRITEPTEGRVEIRGRVGSLLEVGTGFHPELSGRENTFLNGAILGMSRREIARRFDEIVAFAEVAPFIDLPVKHYSSGMYLRLAFAVAAHLEPEILIVDEVLAVGDAAFQRKCLGKMNDVARQGRTVLFVSHNMDAIQRLCARCVLLDRGRITAEGPADAIVPLYLARASDLAGPETWIDLTQAARRGDGGVRILAARYVGDPASAGRAATGGELEVCCLIESDTARDLRSLAVAISTRTGVKLLSADSLELGETIPVPRGRSVVGIRIAALHLNPGSYLIGLWIGDSAGHAIDYIEEGFELEVVPPRHPGFGAPSNGMVACEFRVLEARPEPRPWPME